VSATYGFNRATITISDSNGVREPVVHSKTSVLVRGGRARLRTAQGRLITPPGEKVGVLRSERLANNTWRTTFVDGEVWDVVVDKEGCSTC
jgi:hypothetical protein